MNITTTQLRDQYRRLGQGLRDEITAGIRDAAHVNLLIALAVASRETGMRNIVGDGGHGRGMFQQDDRYQQQFLRETKGCRDGTNVPVFSSAMPAERVPTVRAGAARMAVIVEGNIDAAQRLGVKAGSRFEFALAAYNAGLGGATDGWRHGDVDRNTAGGDYSQDVMDRYHALKVIANG